MLSRIALPMLAAAVMVGAGPVRAQDSAGEEGGADSAEQQDERRRAESELERAQAELERAAREVARLSQELTAPIRQRFVFAHQRAMLGISIEDDPRGVRVRGVSPNGPAALAGVQAGDVIVAVDGALLPTGDQSPSRALLAQMAHVQPGENVVLDLERDGVQRQVTVQARAFGPREFVRDGNFDFDLGFDRFGFFRDDAWSSMELVELTPELGSYFGTERGILVVRGPNRAGIDLRDGDVILDIGGREPSSPEHAMRILRSFEPGETLRIDIMRQQRRETLELVLPEEEQRG